MTLKIREVKEDELETVYKLEREIYDTPWSWSFFKLMAGTVKDLFLVATKNNELIGYTVAELESRNEAGKTGHIMNIAVKKGYRKKGIGTQLMDEIERRLKEKGATDIYLEVKVSNRDAIRLYESRGYLIRSEIKDYYEDENAFVMTKTM